MKQSILLLFLISCISLSAQKVGVNKTNPEYTLDVRSINISDASQVNISNPDKSRYLRLFSGSDAFPDPSMTWNPGHNLLFATFNDATSAFTEYMRINSDGIITAPGFDIAEITDAKALVTKEYVDINAASGLEALDEGNGIGYRIINTNPDNYGNIGENAVDMSNNPSASSTHGATGENSIAMGYRTIASGTNSFAMGDFANATGNGSTAIGNTAFATGGGSFAVGEVSQATGAYSIAMGRQPIASGETSVSLGAFTVASGKYSSALGYGTEAFSHGETVVGTFNEDYTPNDPFNFDENDRVFVVGNGTLLTASNALTVLKNGTITAPSFDISEITDDKALITKEYMDAKVSGLEAIDEGNGIGYRLINSNPDNHGDIGVNAVDLSYNPIQETTNGATGQGAVAMGNRTTASGRYSFAMGDSTTATGSNAVALGNKTNASSFHSFAAGVRTKASGEVSLASGIWTEASGNYSFTMGFRTNAESHSSLAIGRYNIGGGNPTNWVPSDPLFEIGNGTNSFNRINALTVLKSGDVGLVTNSPQAKLHISEGNDTGLGPNNGYLLLGETSGVNISLDNNEIMAKNNGNAADLNLQIEGGNVKIGGPVFIGDETIEDAGNNALRFNAALLPDVDNVNVLGNPTQRWTTVYATNGMINTSDRREKKNIKSLDYGLKEVLEMQPVSFNWKDDNKPDLKLGLIAQDLQELIPEVVKSHTLETNETTGQVSKKELERLGVYYSDLVPVLIKAIQEQQEIINAQNDKIDAIERKLDALLEVNNQRNN